MVGTYILPIVLMALAVTCADSVCPFEGTPHPRGDSALFPCGRSCGRDLAVCRETLAGTQWPDFGKAAARFGGGSELPCFGDRRRTPCHNGVEHNAPSCGPNFGSCARL